MFHSLGSLSLTANELSYSVWYLLDELDRERDGMMARVSCLEVSVNLISHSQQLGTTLLRIFHIMRMVYRPFSSALKLHHLQTREPFPVVNIF